MSSADFKQLLRVLALVALVSLTIWLCDHVDWEQALRLQGVPLK